MRSHCGFDRSVVADRGCFQFSSVVLIAVAAPGVTYTGSLRCANHAAPPRPVFGPVMRTPATDDPGSAAFSHWTSVSFRCGTLAPSRNSHELPSFTAACVCPGLPRRASRGSTIFAESIGSSHMGRLDGPARNADLSESEIANESAGATASKFAERMVRRLYMWPTRRTSHCVG